MVSTLTTEPLSYDADVFGGQRPVCFLTSGEEVFWSQPRACWVLGRARGPDPERDLLILTIDPPAIGQRFGRGGEDIGTLVVTPTARGQKLGDLDSLPVDVHLLLLRTPWARRPVLGRDELELVGRGKLVQSWGQAVAEDRTMQRMNGPRP